MPKDIGNPMEQNTGVGRGEGDRAAEAETGPALFPALCPTVPIRLTPVLAPFLPPHTPPQSLFFISADSKPPPPVHFVPDS